MIALSWDRRARSWLTGSAPEGAIVAVYDRAAHLEGAGGTLLSIVAAPAGNAPMTLVVALPVGARLPLSRGAPASVHGGNLLLGDLSIELGEARLWQQGGRPGSRISPTRLRRSAEQLRGAVLEYGRPGGLYPVMAHLEDLLEGLGPLPEGLDTLARFAWPRLAGLVASWRAGRPDEAAAHAAGLVGLGPGATPSGDDLLAGLMVALRRGLLALGRQDDGARAFALRCMALAPPTARLAQARLLYAAEDEIDEVVDDLFSSLFARGKPRLAELAARATRMGHSSGTDTLIGVLLGLRLAVEWHPLRTRPAPPGSPDG